LAALLFLFSSPRYLPPNILFKRDTSGSKLADNPAKSSKRRVKACKPAFVRAVSS
jgi:hypothetical protein